MLEAPKQVPFTLYRLGIHMLYLYHSTTISIVSYVSREVSRQKNTVLPARTDKRNIDIDVIELMEVNRAAVSTPIPVSHRFKVTRI